MTNLEINFSEFEDKDLQNFIKRFSAYSEYFSMHDRPLLTDLFEELRGVFAEELTFRELFGARSAEVNQFTFKGLSVLCTSELSALSGWLVELVPKIREESGSMASFCYKLAIAVNDELLTR